MLFDVDESLKVMLRNLGRIPKDVDIQFDAPTREWAARRGGPVVDVFLYDIRENLDRRHMIDEPIRENDRVLGRSYPTRWFNCSYLVTAWTQRADDEHRVLGGLMMGLLTTHTVPADCLRGGLTETTLPITMTLARPLAAERSISDIWSALGGELKPSLDLVVCVPFTPSTRIEVGPPVMEAPSLHIEDTQTRRSKGDSGRTPGYRRAKASNDADPIEAPTLRPERAIEEVVGGTPEQPGRRIRVGTMEHVHPRRRRT
jgi:hypothetical protein